MAAAMLASSRWIPRSISRITLSRNTVPNGKSVPRRSKHINCVEQNVNTKLPALSQANYRNQDVTLQSHRVSAFYSIRNFQTSSVFYEDVKVVPAPAFAESITEGDVRWEKGIGDAVEEDEVVAEIETDKTAIQVKAPCAGVIQELLMEDGAKVTAGMDLFKMTVGGAGAAPAKEKPAEKAAETPKETPKESAPPSSAAGPIPSSAPSVPPLPSAPKASKPAAAVKPTPAARPAAGPSDAPAKGTRGETRVKMNRMRQRIAQRLKDAQNTCAMLTTFNEIDMSNIMEMRTMYKDAFLKKHNIKLGFMSAFIKAAAYSLLDQPAVNGAIDDLEIVYRDYVDISVAVATPKGLVVPVLRNVETMNYAEIEHGLNELGEKARSGTLAIEDMDGGTFTISNGGVFGSLMGTPIINPPQSAILGMHGIFERPVAIKGKVEVRPMMYVALTYDHRLIDGREAVLFLRKIKSTVEDPRVLLLDL